jgi:hypothetical protein
MKKWCSILLDNYLRKETVVDLNQFSRRFINKAFENYVSIKGYERYDPLDKIKE